LRGRVGRSRNRAYAYLVLQPDRAVAPTAAKRLKAIEEFTELGSGFNLAMRDLEIRGAGNLLGGEQSGFIMEMGFEMYERILRESVEELKEEEFKELFAKPAPGVTGTVSREPVIDADVDALIPEFYVESDTERLDIYRRLYKATSRDELDVLREELNDRFGEYPQEVEHLFLLVELRLLATRAALQRISLNENLISITLPEERNEAFYGKEGAQDSPFQRVMNNIMTRRPEGVQLKQEGTTLVLQFLRPVKKGVRERLAEAKERIEEIAEWAGIEIASSEGAGV
jgi:transcription-repair coupling factor (superfamily II helicase)